LLLILAAVLQWAVAFLTVAALQWAVLFTVAVLLVAVVL
jgi:hypothetical protein